MHKFISKYALAAHLALLAAAPLFLFPFCNERQISVVMLWMSALTLLWLLLEPSRRYGERLHDARKRSLNTLLRDPLLWAFVVLFLFAVVRSLNGNVALSYDFVGEEWFISPSYIEFLPGCVKSSSLTFISTLIASAVAVLACRHTLGAKARSMAVCLSSLFAGLAFLVALFAYRFGYSAHELHSFASYKSASFVGTGFGLFFVAGVVSLGSMLKHKWNKMLLFFSLAIGLAFSGLLFFAPPFIVVVYTVVGLLALIGVFIYGLISNNISTALKVLAAFLLALGIPVSIVVALPLHDLTQIKDVLFSSASIFPDGYIAQRVCHNGIALTAWQESLWHGKGIGAFPLLIKLTEPETNWVLCSFNAWSQLLVERGIVGMIMFFVPLCIMSVTYVLRLVSADFKKTFWPMALFGVLNLIVVIAHGFYDSSLFRPEVMIASGIFFAVASSSFPASKSDSDGN